MVLRLGPTLAANQVILQTALVERKFWTDIEHGPWIPSVDYHYLLTGANDPVRDFLARCLDVQSALRRVEQLASSTGLGKALSVSDARLISDALRVINSALDLSDAARKSLHVGSPDDARRPPRPHRRHRRARRPGP